MYYTDKKGDKHSISKKELEYAVDLKIEYQKSNNGKCNWKSLCSKLRKIILMHIHVRILE